jgi:hypothetical protein
VADSIKAKLVLRMMPETLMVEQLKKVRKHQCCSNAKWPVKGLKKAYSYIKFVANFHKLVL